MATNLRESAKSADRPLKYHPQIPHIFAEYYNALRNIHIYEYSTLWILFALLAAVVLLFGGGMMGFGMGSGMGLGAIIMLLFWGAIIWLVISLVNAGTKRELKG